MNGSGRRRIRGRALIDILAGCVAVEPNVTPRRGRRKNGRLEIGGSNVVFVVFVGSDPSPTTIIGSSAVPTFTAGGAATITGGGCAPPPPPRDANPADEANHVTETRSVAEPTTPKDPR